MLTKEECLEAYNNLYDGSYDVGHDFQLDYDVIKKLINEHFDNREFKEKNFDTVCELYNSLLKDYEKVNEALDKACEELNEWCLSCGGIDEELHGVYPNFKTKDEWKEYLLKEVKEDD